MEQKTFTKQQFSAAYNTVQAAAIGIYKKPQFSNSERETILRAERIVVGTNKSQAYKMRAMLPALAIIKEKQSIN